MGDRRPQLGRQLGEARPDPISDVLRTRLDEEAAALFGDRLEAVDASRLDATGHLRRLVTRLLGDCHDMLRQNPRLPGLPRRERESSDPDSHQGLRHGACRP